MPKILEGYKRSQRKYINSVEACIENFEECEETFRLTVCAIGWLKHIPAAKKALYKFADEEDKDKDDSIKKLSVAAEIQINNGFPLITTQTVVSLWSFFEACIYDAVLHWMVATKFKTIDYKLRSAKVSFDEIHGKTLAQRAECLIATVNRENSQKNIIGKFEMLFEMVGWKKGGNLHKKFIINEKIKDKKILKDLNEFYKVRNVIVHRGGIVDRKFKKECPWRKDKLGEKIKIQEKDIARFVGSSLLFLSEVLNRIYDCQNEKKIK